MNNIQINKDRELWDIYCKTTGFKPPNSKTLSSFLKTYSPLLYIEIIEGLAVEEEKFYLEILEKKLKILNNKTPIVISILVCILIVYIIYTYNSTSLNVLLRIGMSLYISFLAAFPIGVITYAVEKLSKRIWINSIPGISRFRDLQKKILSYKQYQFDFWSSLNGRQFEIEVANFFKKQGYDTMLTKATGDEGVDIVLRKNGQKIIVQCKAHKKSIGVAVVRDLLGTMIHQNADQAIIVSLSGFSKNVYEFAIDKNIKLMTVNDILMSGI